jgi:hypothetical protein
MSNFPRQFPLGAPFNGELPSGAVDAFDVALTKCPNFTEGSDHSASNPVILRNKGMQFASTLHVEPYITKATLQTAATLECATGSFVNFKGTCSIHLKDTCVLTVESTAIVTVEGTLETAAGSTLSIDGDCTFDVDSITQHASGSVEQYKSGSSVDFEAGASVSVHANVTQLAGTFTQSSKVFRSGSGGRTRVRRATLVPNSTQNFSVANDHYRYEHSVVGDVTLKASKTTAPTPEDGEVITVTVINSSTGVVTITSEGSGTPIVMSAHSFTVSVIFDADLNRWALFSIGDAGAHITIGGNA